MKYFAKRILLALIALLPISAFADQLEVTFPPPPALDVNGLPAQVLSWDVYVNGALREEGVPLSVASRTYEITEFRQYSVQVAAINSVGVGALSAAATVDYNQPRGVPSRSGAPGVRILMIGGGGGGSGPAPITGTNAERINAILNGRTPHFSWNMPADPVTTREVTVTTAAEFNAQAAIAGTKININNSFSGNIQINADDIDVVMSSTATISGSLRIESGGSFINRIRWTGGNIKNIVGARYNDFLMDDVYAVASETYSGGQLPEHSFNIGAYDNNRLAIINSTLEVAGIPPPSQGYGAWALHSSYVTDSFIGNVKCISNHQNNRMAHVTRRLIVDSAFNPDGQSSNAFRLHDESVDVWIKDSFSVNFMKMDSSGAPAAFQAQNVLFDNYDRYWDVASNYLGANTGTWQNSTLYNPNFPTSGGWNYGTLTEGVNQTEELWDGSTIDYADMPGKSSLADYGAVR